MLFSKKNEISYNIPKYGYDHGGEIAYEGEQSITREIRDTGQEAGFGPDGLLYSSEESRNMSHLSSPEDLKKHKRGV